MMRSTVSVAGVVAMTATTRRPFDAGDECRLHRLGIGHLAEEDDVGILTKHSRRTFGEARRVGTDLALRDDRALVDVEELDRILDRHDVRGAVLVDAIDEHRDGRRTTRARARRTR